MANLLGHVPEGALPVRVVLKVPEVAFLEKVLEKWLQPLKKWTKYFAVEILLLFRNFFFRVHLWIYTREI